MAIFNRVMANFRHSDSALGLMAFLSFAVAYDFDDNGQRLSATRRRTPGRFLYLPLTV